MDRKLSLKYTQNNIIYNCFLDISYVARKINLKFISDFIKVEVKDIHPFVALEEIRKKLEPHDILLLCKGSRIDVYAAGGFISGTGALKLELGKRSDPVFDIVKIFDEETDVTKLATVEQQKEYYNNWLKSIQSIA